jgi:hypothetical protein
MRALDLSLSRLRVAAHFVFAVGLLQHFPLRDLRSFLIIAGSGRSRLLVAENIDSQSDSIVTMDRALKPFRSSGGPWAFTRSDSSSDVRKSRMEISWADVLLSLIVARTTPTNFSSRRIDYSSRVLTIQAT